MTTPAPGHAHGHAHGAPGAGADSGGVPWAGRTLTPSPFAGDDGAADERVVAALADRDATGPAAVVAALAGTRVFVPVVAVAAGEEASPLTGVTSDTGADMAVVTLQAPDGRRAMPVFTSTAALSAWDPAARPVPSEVERAALSAADEGCALLVVDPAAERPFVVPRPALEALAQQRAWRPSWERDDVAAAVRAAAEVEPAVASAVVERGRRAETAVVLALAPGLDRPALDALLERVQTRLAASPLVAEAVDSLEVRLTTAS
ncbi:SseB family protein [Pseudokineococcus marinus]|uniref:SseB family protein n=1 Tax=Pseudokineococcus marinus TaxID=351215 RepID=A0A849BSL6_9ACTN|nr:SseB family protein [Pseudokineococcus marinus]NNH22526.1 SseB family protein [Pseudokineococcus marinus]